MAKKKSLRKKSVEARAERSVRASVITPQFNRELQEWTRNQLRIAIDILQMMEFIRRDPFAGIGKPEPLQHLGANIWSRRITVEHRLVYLVADDAITFLQCMYHYQ